MAEATYAKLVEAAAKMGASPAGQVPFNKIATLVNNFNAAKTDQAKARVILQIKRLVKVTSSTSPTGSSEGARESR